MINHGSRSTWGFLDPDYRPKNVFHSNKNTGVCNILSFIMFSPKHMLRLQSHPIPFWAPITPGFVSGLSLGSQGVIKLTSGKILYNLI